MRDYQISVKIVIEWDMSTFLWDLIIWLFENYNKYNKYFVCMIYFGKLLEIDNLHKKPGDKYFVGVRKTSSFLFIDL